ncbi:MAG: hypothetical protein ACMXYM_05180 [Candidatus Woesearchaeota archaeon]
MQPGFPVGLIISSLMMIFGVVIFYRRLSKYLLIKNTPTQKTRAAVQGYGEFSGRAEPVHLIETPISKLAAVAFRLEIYQFTGSGKSRSRDTILDITHAPRFILRDDTGSIIVDAPRDQSLFTLLQPSHQKKYLISRGSFFEAWEHSVSHAKILIQVRKHTLEYYKAYAAYEKGGSYAKVEDAVRAVVAHLDENLDAFGPITEGRGGNGLIVTEQAILPDDEVLVLGTVVSEEGENVITKGKEGAFVIGCGSESQVLRRFRRPLLLAILLLIAGIALFVLILMAGP